MRIYFSNDDNLQSLKEYFENLYITTIDKSEKHYKYYKKKLQNREELNDNDYHDCCILFNELRETIKTLRDDKFEIFFLKLGFDTLEKIRYASVSEHTENCVVRAVFDILLKYTVDFECKICHLCCSNQSFKKMQFDILRDLKWKIIEN